MQTTGVEHAEALPGSTSEADLDRRRFHIQVAVALGNLAGHPGPHGAITVGDLVVEGTAGFAVDGGQHVFHHLLVQQRLVERLVTADLTVGGLVRRHQVVAQDRGQIQLALTHGLAFQHFQQVGTTDELGNAFHAQQRQQLTDFLGHKGEVVDQQLRSTNEVLLAQIVTLGRYAGGAVVQVTDTQVLTAQHDHRHGAETERLGTQDGRLDHVQTGLQTTIGLQPDLVAQVVATQGLMGFRQAQLPGRARIADGGQRAGRGTAVVTGNGDQVRVGLGHTGGHGPHARLGHQLHGHLGIRVDLLEVEDQLGQILNGIDIVVRRRRDQGHAGHGVTQTRDQRIHLAAGQLAALAGLGALGHLDLQHFGIDQVMRGHAETTRGDLLDLGYTLGAVTGRVFAALTGV